VARAVKTDGFAARDGRTGRSWSGWQRLENHAWYVGVRVLLALADRIPARPLLALGRSAGALVHALLPRLRETARENLARALPGRETNRVARDCIVQAGENLALTLLLRRPRTRALDLVQIPTESRAILTEALSEGRGVVFVSAHLGPFELIAAALAELGLNPAVVVRESYDARLDPHVDQHRVRRGVKVIHRGRAGAASRMLRALREGRPVGFLPDLGGRVPSEPARFLGETSPLPVGPQRVATKARCPLVVGTLAPRTPDAHPGLGPVSAQSRFALRVCRLRATDEKELTRAMYAALSREIRANPVQWLWMAPRLRSLQRNRA
jgi:KDO2-lipid IV(A) lauroyltransferase